MINMVDMIDDIEKNDEEKNIKYKENKEIKFKKPSLTLNNIISNDGVPHLEYINEIWDSFIEKEKFNNYSYENIISKQNDITKSMRYILVDWLISLQNKMFRNFKTLFLTINLIDRYLSNKQISRDIFQLLGVTALFIASKYEEIYTKNINE